jgi:hypothetical protein
MLQPPRRRKDRGWIRPVHNNVVQDQVVGSVQLCQPMPGPASIQGLIEPTVGGAKVEMMGLAGNRRERARIPASGANRAPIPLRSQSGNRKRKQDRKENQERYLPESFRPPGLIKANSQAIHAEHGLPDSRIVEKRDIKQKRLAGSPVNL